MGGNSPCLLASEEPIIVFLFRRRWAILQHRREVVGEDEGGLVVRVFVSGGPGHARAQRVLGVEVGLVRIGALLHLGSVEENK